MIGILSIGALALLCGLILAAANRLFVVKEDGQEVQEKIEELLPGAQCGQCGSPGCSQAAEALVKGENDVTMCPPGGNALVEQLADLMGVPVPTPDAAADVGPQVAFIGEDLCIGCTKCQKACPTDAIVGASRQIHSVLPQHCTACNKCVEVCPTETVQLLRPPEAIESWSWPAPSTSTC